MYYILVIIAVTSGQVSTISTPLPDVAKVEQCQIAGEKMRLMLLEQSDSVDYVCMKSKND